MPAPPLPGREQPRLRERLNRGAPEAPVGEDKAARSKGATSYSLRGPVVLGSTA